MFEVAFYLALSLLIIGDVAGIVTGAALMTKGFRYRGWERPGVLIIRSFALLGMSGLIFYGFRSEMLGAGTASFVLAGLAFLSSIYVIRNDRKFALASGKPWSLLPKFQQTEKLPPQ